MDSLVEGVVHVTAARIRVGPQVLDLRTHAGARVGENRRRGVRVGGADAGKVVCTTTGRLPLNLNQPVSTTLCIKATSPVTPSAAPCFV